MSGTDGAAPRTPSILPSRLLPKFLAALARAPSPVLLDLGPAVGRNITFFGERLACKIVVEDVLADVERAVRAGRPAMLAGVLRERFASRTAMADGVLCWDVFDYLDGPAADALARGVVGALRAGGVAMGWFATAAADPGHYTRFVVVDERRLEHRPYPASDTRRRVRQSREIMGLFAGLEVAEQVLLKTNSREVLFRKP